MYEDFAAIIPWDGISKKGLYLDKLSTPAAWDYRVKFTENDETFVISNCFSTVSPTSALLKLMIPSSGWILTSGLTPVPFKLTETIVVPEYITIRSSYICWACGSNWITTGLVSPGFKVLIALSTENPPNGVRASILNVSLVIPTFLIKISWVYLKATGISPNSRTSSLGIKVLFTVVVLASINVLITSVCVLPSTGL